MSAVRIILALSLALILSLILIGCGQGEGALPQDEIDQIAANTVAAAAKVNTFKVDLNVSGLMEITGGKQSGKTNMVMDTTGMIDNANKQIQMFTAMSFEVSGQAKQEIGMDYYVVGEWMYMNVNLPELGEQWMKMEITEEIWDSATQMGEIIEMLKQAVEVDSLGTDNVNGTPCYVLEITPDWKTWAKWLSAHRMSQNIDYEKVDIAQLVKRVSIKVWIAKDSYWIMKTELDTLMEVRPGDLGSYEGEFERMTMDMNGGVKFYDYNQPVSIVLPSEALEAEEMPH